MELSLDKLCERGFLAVASQQSVLVWPQMRLLAEEQQQQLKSQDLKAEGNGRYKLGLYHEAIQYYQDALAPFKGELQRPT